MANHSPLQAVLNAIEQANRPISLTQLSTQLEIEPSALEGMLEFWARKGRIQISGEGTCSPTGCGGCSVANCPAVIFKPRRFDVIS